MYIAMSEVACRMYIAMYMTELLQEANPFWRDPAATLAGGSRQRALFGPLMKHLSSNERRAAVLTGPRQVGKTTLLLQLGDALLKQGVPPAQLTYFDFSDDRLPAAGISAREVVDYLPPAARADLPRFFLLDEISRSTRWSEWLKHAVDHKQGRFLVTDSAAAVLARGARESGLGRWDEYRMESLTFREFLALQAPDGESPEAAFPRFPNAYSRYMSFGGRPEFVFEDSLGRALRRIRSDTVDRAIVRDLLRRDVDVERVRELFVYLVEDSGAIFDPKARARLLQRPEAPPVDRRTLDKWTALLLESLLLARLDTFAPSATGRLAGRSHPKLYASDHGLIVAFSGVAEPLADPSVMARALEAVVFLHLRELAERSNFSISYLRDKGGRTEIDFVVHKGPEILALIEVTTSKDPRKKLDQLVSSGLAAKKAVRVVVHGGSEERLGGPVRLAPTPKFLLDPNRWIGGA